MPYAITPREPLSKSRILIGTAIFLFLAYALFTIAPKIDEKAKFIAHINEHVVDYAHAYALTMLKAPATADFGEPKVTKISPQHYRVNSYVDAQNSFGAKIRTYFDCRVRADENLMIVTVLDCDF